MKIQINGKQIDIGVSLREHVIERITQGVSRYFDDPVEGQVTFSREGRKFRVDCLVHVGHGIRLRSHATADDAYVVFDKAADRIEKQLRRYKNRLSRHQNSHRISPSPVESAPIYILEREGEDVAVPDVFDPVIIAEESTDIPTLTVGEAECAWI